jgi:hypothetical protein
MTTKTKNDCKTRGLCHYDSLTKMRPVDGMLLTAEYLRNEQTYHREALKRLNRHLYGAGIVCGLEVTEAGGLCIKVHPGFALDCCGNALEVCKCITIDLADVCKTRYPDGCVPETAETLTRYLVIRYDEIASDPEPLLTPADDCAPAGEGTQCEASKYREGFCLEIREECPDTAPCEAEQESGRDGLFPFLVRLGRTRGGDDADTFEEYRPDCMKAPPCPECHCHHCAVGLAKLEIDCGAKTVSVAECGCRQVIWSARMLGWLACNLFANLETLSKDSAERRLPSASEIVSRPLQGAWDAAGALLDLKAVEYVQREVADIKSRLNAVEKAQAAGEKAPKTKPKE